MDTLEYTQFDNSHNHQIGHAPSMVKHSFRTNLTRGQIDLLEMLPERDDVILLDDAVAIVSRTGRQAYGQIVTLINRGAIAVEFLRHPTVDPEIILRRL
ncbi:hypothetical protein [Aureimonas sp. AU22]|uniref:hypothetical protein n=1 Tax=Aureimonas sp. AU22 TaxID=1638162 RepID=UPI00078634CC|nr:hypothetical protein [Aureimonas sp. AU22]